MRTTCLGRARTQEGPNGGSDMSQIGEWPIRAAAHLIRDWSTSRDQQATAIRHVQAGEAQRWRRGIVELGVKMLYGLSGMFAARLGGG
jgi:hypothetical protein